MFCERKLVLFFMMLSCMVFWVFPVGAESSAALKYHFFLSDEDKSYSIAEQAFIMKDPEGLYDYSEVLKLYKSKKKGKSSETPYLDLGTEGVPHWIVFTVSNRSDTSQWALNFGKRLDGRLGFVDKLFVYEHYTRTTFFKGLPDRMGEKTEEGTLRGTVLPINLARGGNALVVLYVVPYSGFPGRFPLVLEKEAYALEQIGTDLLPHFTFFVSAVFSALFLFLMFVSKRLNSLFFALYYAALSLFVYFHDAMLFDPLSLAPQIMIWLFFVLNLIGLFMTRLFVQSGTDSYSKNITFLSGAFSLLLLTLISAFVVPEGSVVKSVFLWGTFPFTAIIALVLSILYVKEEQAGTFLYMQGWGIAVIGFFLTFASVSGLYETSDWMFYAFEFSLLIQGLFIFAAVKTTLSFDTGSIMDDFDVRQESTDKAFEKLKQSKESAELKRLLSVIEKERQVMHELREREAQKTEEMRIAKEEADKANGAKSAFLAVVSHEIRTPMTGVMGIVKLLLDTKLSKDQSDYAQTIQDSGNAMMALLNDILDFEKIEKGKMELEYISFDLHRLVHSVHTLMSGHANAKNIGLVLDLEDSVPQFVLGDPTRLRQVLLNLTGNSIKFTSDGDVTIHVRNVVDAVDTGNSKMSKKHGIYFAIQDSGIGISPEAKKNLFTPFAQADSSISRKFGGTGLGLAICKSLVRAMGSDISISSKENEGSTFFFTLDMEQGDQEEIEAVGVGAAKDTPPDKELSVLVVDDNQINQKVLHGFLTKMGHRAFPAMSGEEALQKLKRDVFDLILMDVQMPGMTGLEATEEIRKIPNQRAASTPVVAMTGNTMEDDVQACFEAGMDDFLAKPIDTNKLAEIVDKTIKAVYDTKNKDEKDKDDGPAISESTDSESSVGSEDEALITPPSPPSQPSPVVEEEPEPVLPVKEEPTMTSTEFSPQDINFTDEELDEDSFEEAVRVFGEAEKRASVSRPVQREAEPFSGSRDENRGGIERPPIAAFADTVSTSSFDDGKKEDIFDEQALSSLKGSLAKDQFEELLDGMLEKTDELVEALQALSGVEDLTDVIARAHELKGMTGNFGLIYISALAKEIEMEAKAGNTESLPLSIGKLPDAAAQSRRALQDWCKA